MTTETIDMDADEREPAGGPASGDDPGSGDGQASGGADDGSDEGAGGPDVERGTPARRPTRTPWVVASVACVVALVAAAAAVVAVERDASMAATIGEVEAAAGDFAQALTTWDASDGMQDTRRTLQEAGTDTFAGDVDQLFGGTGDLASLEELGARSEGEVEDVLVQAVDGDRAEALAVVVQRVTTSVTDGEEVSLRYARLHLQRDSDRWYIDAVDLVVDALQQAAARTDLTQPSGPGGSGEGAGVGEDEG